MNNLAFIDVVTILAYLLFMMGIGFYGLKKRKNLEEYYVGGRSSGPFTLACLWMSSWIGGATVVGSVDKAYDIGISSVWYCLSMAIGCVIFALTSASIIHRLGTQFSCLTYPELIEKRYGPGARIISTFTTFLAYIAYTAGQFLAMALIIQAAFDLDRDTAIWLSGASMVIYTALGGFAAVSLTSIIQALTILITLAFILAPYLWVQSGGIETLSTTLPEGFFNFGAWGWEKILGMTVTIVLTFYTSMDSYTRCFAAKNAASSRWGTMIAALMVAAIAFGTTFIGLAAKGMIPTIAEGQTTMSSIIFQLIPAGLKGVVLVGLLAAIMSTGSVCLLVASANITRDIYQRFLQPDASHKRLVMLGSIAAVIVGILACYLAIAKKNIIDVLYIAFTINSAGLFVPTIVALIGWKRGNAKTAIISMGLTLLTVVSWYIGQATAPDITIFQYDPVWPGLLVSCTTFFIGAWIIPMSAGEVHQSTTFTDYAHRVDDE